MIHFGFSKASGQEPVLKPGDAIKIVVYGNQELSQTVVVKNREQWREGIRIPNFYALHRLARKYTSAIRAERQRTE